MLIRNKFAAFLFVVLSAFPVHADGLRQGVFGGLNDGINSGGSGAPGWVLSGAAVDCLFTQSQCYSSASGVVPVGSLISVTRAQTVSSYATTSTGLLVPFAANTPRITNQGLLVEQGSTNTALYSRDMTQASWVAVNMTPVLNAVGADGVANSATTLTATAGNATILQPLTIGSTTETYSVYLKRVSGTGTINISENGGSSWTACTINSSTFTRCQVEATLANPSVGIQIVTNGDVIVADFNQNEALAFATSPIPTTTVNVTRAADVVTATGKLFNTMVAAQGSVLLLTGAMNNLAAGDPYGLVGNNTSINTYFRFLSTSVVRSIFTTGSNLNATAGVGSFASLGKSAIGWNAAGRSLVANNGTLVSDSSILGTPSTLDIGSINGSNSIDGYIARLSAWNSRLPDATLKALTQ